jgi:acetyltransferase-like isoleucine patch superfamily enzyme
LFNTPWKIINEIQRWIVYLVVRFDFFFYRIPWGKGWRIHGRPVIQKHRHSNINIGSRLGLRSTVRSNPLGPNHPVILCTWNSGAVIEIGDHFAMTGGSIIAVEQIKIGNRVAVGANCTIMDTDFHPTNPEQRLIHPQDAQSKPIVIEDDVFIGMNCLILKGVRVGKGAVIAAGSIVVKDVPPGVVVAGNPAKVVGQVSK